jgi:hypothetical protein
MKEALIAPPGCGHEKSKSAEASLDHGSDPSRPRAIPRLLGQSQGGVGLPAITVALIVLANLALPAASQESLQVAEASAPRSSTGDRAETSNAGACEIKELKKSEIQGVKVSFPDGSRFLINREDENEVAQVYVSDFALVQSLCRRPVAVRLMDEHVRGIRRRNAMAQVD